ncbi:hypothetical protein [Sphingobium boeckii]|uniref:UrcA family protein n=1 Tax=Sphingobium boeckii TaxID=1082345 RepID=A0A7W9AGZ2_9SPHN|nr:hypothetical protein [Sphingobium boeckii]MBB5685393.1 hypothetical protein [Sphingobium boeckii]
MTFLAMALLGANPVLIAPMPSINADRIATLDTAESGTITIAMHQTGFTAPNRADTARCTWSSALPTGGAANGWRAGGCAEMTSAIKADAAKQVRLAALANGASRPMN